jgi:hypothetical protein
MTIEELKTIADTVLHYGVKMLRCDGDVPMLFHLVRADGTMEFIPVPGAVTNNARAKYLLSEIIKDRIKAGGIEAVIMLSDVWWGFLSEENYEYRRRMKWSVRECQEHGLMEKKRLSW